MLPKSVVALRPHHHDSTIAGDDDMPAALRPRHLMRGITRVVLFAAVVVVIVVTLPGLGSIRTRLSHGAPGWLAVAAGLRLASALAYVVTFRAIFSPRMPFRTSYKIAMSEVGLNAVVPAGGAGGLAIGGWVLHRQGLSTEWVLERSAEFFVFTSAFNVGAVAVLGWLAAAGVVPMHVSLALEVVPAALATILIAAAAILAPRLESLRAGQSRHRPRSPIWLAIELAVMLGTGARGAIRLFAEHDPQAILGAAGYLAFDVCTLWATLRAFHGHPAMAALAMAYLVGQLAGEIPVPGGLGVVDGGLIGALVLYGLPVTLATAGSLAYRAIALLVPIVFGGIAAVGLVRSLHDTPAIPAPTPASQ